MAHGGEKFRLGAHAGLGDAARLDQLLVVLDQFILPPLHLQRGQQTRAEDGGLRRLVDAVQRAELKRAQLGRRVVRVGERDEQRDGGRRMFLELAQQFRAFRRFQIHQHQFNGMLVKQLQRLLGVARRGERDALRRQKGRQLPAHWESLPTSNICDADWLMANNSVFISWFPSKSGH